MNKYHESIQQEEILRVLERIQQNPQVTQRDLVKEVGISLGKINFLIKSLTEKGIIKAKRFKNSKQKLAYLYTITPGGIRRKAILTEKFLRIKMKEYDELKIQIEKLKLEVTAGAKQQGNRSRLTV